MKTPAPARGLKLQKALADSGLGSRREMERWIASGRVTVNNVRAVLSERVTPHDRIEVDGRPLDRYNQASRRVLAMNKQEGLHVTTKPPHGARSVFDQLPSITAGRWISVGRLDVNSSGLLLFTNDGELAHRLMHPSSNIDREYAVRVTGVLEQEQIEQLLAGIRIDGSVQRFSDVRYFDGRGTNHWYHVVLTEGRNREVRRLFAAQGLMVSRLKRVRFGPIALHSWVRSGKCVELVPGDVAALYRSAGIEYRPEKTPKGGHKIKSRSLLISHAGQDPIPSPIKRTRRLP